MCLEGTNNSDGRPIFCKMCNNHLDDSAVFRMHRARKKEEECSFRKLVKQRLHVGPKKKRKNGRREGRNIQNMSIPRSGRKFYKGLAVEVMKSP